MPRITREDLLRKDKIVLKDDQTKRIKKVVYHQDVEFGINSLGTNGDKTHVKEVKFFNGLSGSLQKLTDGSNYLVGGTGIVVANNSNGSITITNNGSGVGTITGVTAGQGLSGGGTTGAVTLNLDINSLVAINDTTFSKDDSFPIHDQNIGTNRKITFEDMMEFASAGTNSGITEGSGQLKIDINNLAAENINVAEDFIAFSDEGASGDPTKKESIVDFMAAVAGTGLSAGSGQLSVSNLGVAQGGTGNTAFSDMSVVITQDSGDDQLSAVSMSTNGQLLIGGTSGPAVSTLTEGANISITNGNGSITIAATGVAPGAAGSNTQIQFNDGGSALGTDSTFTFDKSSNTLSSPNLSGSLTRLTDDTSYLIAGNNITITSQSNGSIIIQASELAHSAGDGLNLSGTEFSLDLKNNGGLLIDSAKLAIDDSVVATLTGSLFSGHVGVTGSIHSTAEISGSIVRTPVLTGSLTTLEDGSPYLIGSGSITISTGSNGAVSIHTNRYGAGDGLDLVDSGYTFALDLKEGGGLKISITELTIDDSVIATLTGSTFTGATKHNLGLSGSLTKLIDGKSYLVAGSNIAIASQSNGQVTISSTDTNTEYTAGTGLDLTGTQFSIDDSVVATISGSTFTGVTNHNQGLSGSLTRLTDGTSYLVAGNNVTILTSSNGQVTISAAGGGGSGSPGGSNTQIQFNDASSFGGDSGLVYNKTTNTLTSTNLSSSLTRLPGGTSYLVAGPNISIITQSNGSILITGSASGDANIGSAEDGSYTDGLFIDFTSSTPVGTAVDRFNEVLKSLAPGPAPNLDDIDFNNSSVSGKLSFGSSNTVSGITNSSTTAGFSAVDVDGTFGSSTSGNNLRIGLLNGSTAVTGDLNEDITADTHASGQTNYVANAFGNADGGTLKLEVNGVVVHSVVLTGSAAGHIGTGDPGSGTGTSTNSNGSGFTNLSATGSAKFSDASELDLFQHRTGRYTIAASDQRNGWNYARVIHTLSSGDVNTNYVEWINDNDSNALAGAGDAFDNLSMTGNVNLSGVKYFTGGTAQYRVRVTNAYKNVYSTSNITFTTSDCSISSQAFPSAGNDENKVLHLTGSATISATTLLNESISARAVVPHPLKSGLTATNQTISNILMYNLSNNSTVLQETFRRENYRIQDNSYTNQAAITHSDQAWDSSESLAGSDAGHNTGLMFYNQRLVAPSQGANSSNFAGITNGPGSNVNYSGITSGTKTFYRYFQNNTGGSKTDFTVTINGSGTIVGSGGTLNTSNIKVFLKLPTTDGGQATGFMDLATAFATGQVSDNDGCLNGSLDSSLNATNTATFGTQFVAANEYIVIKIQADASFTGHISQITVAWL